ncbi:MAG TPA: IS1595 family transposase, partial [Firmicutes bacterium]|nr:IS1595 family transposase [Bacillota bacterium]
KKYLQRYLDEFCYRLNRRFSEKVIFHKLVDACLLLGPVTFAESSL